MIETVKRRSNVRRAADELLEKAMDAFGSYAAIARATGSNDNTVQYWYTRGHMPREAALIRMEDAVANVQAARQAQ